MRKGINYWSFAKGTPLKRAIRLAKAAGFEGIEFCMDEEGELSISCSEAEALAIRRLLDDTGLAASSVCSWLGWVYPLTSADPAKREKGRDILAKMIDTAAILGTDAILCVPGYVGCDFIPGAEVVPYETAIARAKEGLASLIPHAKSAGVTIAVENVWNKMLLSPLEMRDFIDELASPFIGAYFDVANCIQTGYAEQWIDILGARIKRVHFKDYRRDPGGFRGFVELLSGDVNFPAVVAALGRAGFAGFCNAEIMPTYTTHTDAVIHNSSMSMDYILGNRGKDQL
ncbi:MAG: sugar phosphate isomerase/epimerase family protein [Rectinemataceae bacterium]